MKRFLPVLTVFAVSAFAGISPSGAQTIATFNSVEPRAQTQSFEIPGTHTFQRIIRTGTTLTAGGNLGGNLDFTGYVPIGGSSTNGYLSVSSETAPAECAILSMSFNSAIRTWGITNSGKVSLPQADIGFCAAFCSGTVTPRNTIMVCEEVTNNGDSNGDSYDDLGWVIEIDPATRTVINQDAAGGVDKLWAMGRQAHENVAIKSDASVAYWGGDNIDNGFMYKFVPATAGNFSAGLLYVLETNAALGTGTWKPVANTTRADRNNTIGLSNAAGAYNFQRIEDVEIGPDGKVYFASTATGRVYRFTDAGTTVSNLQVFVESGNYDVDGTGPFAPVKFEWPDNLAFDGEGNLWVLQDGGDNHIWVVSPTHTTAVPAIKVFGNTPAGSEPTGITFSPDYRFMFISIQHPSASNTTSQADAAGANVIFDENTTLVVARKENLGLNALPLRYVSMNLVQKNDEVEVNWVAAGANEPAFFTVERSVDGINFTKIQSLASVAAANATYTYSDKNLPVANTVYYRLRACSNGNACIYSETKIIKITPFKTLKISPLATRNAIRVLYTSNTAADVLVQVYNSNGTEVYRQKKLITAGQNNFNISIGNGAPGFYVMKVNDGGIIESRSFIR
ncbi:MAG TPA: alkaline phosphatase PhoX [Segetibacter sp.]